MSSEDLGVHPLAATLDGPAEDVAPFEAPILVAVDFSAGAEAALVWACNYADMTGAPVEILHVIHDPGDSPGTYRAENGDWLEPMVDVAERRLGEFLRRVERDNPSLTSLKESTTHCKPGLPAQTILQVARSRGVEHLVLGGARRKGLARLMHRSTASQVAGDVAFTVTVVKAADQ